MLVTGRVTFYRSPAVERTPMGDMDEPERCSISNGVFFHVFHCSLFL